VGGAASAVVARCGTVVLPIRVVQDVSLVEDAVDSIEALELLKDIRHNTRDL